jgi:hypothetical protein
MGHGVAPWRGPQGQTNQLKKGKLSEVSLGASLCDFLFSFDSPCA